MIDTDVHVAPASWDALYPHLDPGWRKYLEERRVTGFHVPTVDLEGLRYAYPPVSRPQAPPATYAELKERFLDGSAAGHVVLNCLTMFELNRNPYFQAGAAAALNDWLRDEWLERDARLRASLVVPWLDPDGAIAEIERAGGDPRFVQVLLPVRAEAPWGQKAFHGIYAAAAERGLAIALHAWGPPNHADNTKGYTTTYVEDYLGNATIAQQHLVSLVAEGVFVRFPGLRFVIAECGFTWLPSITWRMDKDWKGLWPEIPWVRERPSFYVRRNVRLTTTPGHLGGATPEQVRELVRIIGPELLLYASDFPHEHGDPGRLLGALGEADRAAILAGNATELYDLRDARV
ncbi:amidohydrolase family protein [Nonomuraea sp. NPDC005650]|uniref:amidohydrolase family protein n=1 Tax=Nonomuraea sp. NPDC005650 TaxID=3157045 RepID=UPI0033BDFDDD